MTSRLTKIIACFTYMMWPSELAIPNPPSPDPYPISKSMELTYEQTLVAQKVEERLRDQGFSDELIIGALVNAYAESELNVLAVGKEGERGIFQLHPAGLGSNMSVKEMHDIDASVDRVVRAVRKNKEIMQLEENGGSAADHVAAFCINIERPSNKQKKARARVRLMEKILIN